jgi:hypothetical protein
VRDISQARELLGRYGAVGANVCVAVPVMNIGILHRIIECLCVTCQVLQKIGNCSMRVCRRPSYQFNAVSYHPQQKAEESRRRIHTENKRRRPKRSEK